MEDLLVVGRFQGLFGVRGWLKVFSYTRPMQNLAEYAPWTVASAEGLIALSPQQVRAHGKTLVAQIAGYSDRDEAAILLGRDIMIGRQQLPVLEPGAYYWSDLIGFSVVNRREQTLGTVVDMMETGAADVLVVQTELGKRLIPFVRNVYVYEVNLAARRIEVDWELDY